MSVGQTSSSPVGPSFVDYLDPYLEDPDIHELRKSPIAANEIALSLIIAVVIGLIDLWLTIACVNESIAPSFALVIHLVISAVAAFIVFAKHKSDMDTRASSTTLALVAFSGFFGAFGSIAMIIAHLMFRSDSMSFREWVAFIYPRPLPTLGEAIYDDIALKVDDHPRSYDVLPLMDVMRLGTVSQKREAINLAAMHFSPAYSPVLRVALKDPALSVRALAATTMARLEKQLQLREQKLQHVLSHREQTPDLLLVAARFYDDYAFSNIVDNDRSQHYVKQAYELYQRYLRRRSGDVKAAAWVGRLLIRSGQPEKAASWLKQLIDEGRSDSRILSWYLEVMYSLGRFAELRSFAQGYQGKLEQLVHEDHFLPLSDAVHMWLKHGKEVAA